MRDRACQHVRNRLDAAVRMPRETGDVILWMFVPEIVEQQERVEFRRIAEPERALQPHACPLERRRRFDDLFHRPDGHPSFSCGVRRYHEAAGFASSRRGRAPFSDGRAPLRRAGLQPGAHTALRRAGLQPGTHMTLRDASARRTRFGTAEPAPFSSQCPLTGCNVVLVTVR
jgi:hypothetical protein